MRNISRFLLGSAVATLLMASAHAQQAPMIPQAWNGAIVYFEPTISMRQRQVAELAISAVLKKYRNRQYVIYVTMKDGAKQIVVKPFEARSGQFSLGAAKTNSGNDESGPITPAFIIQGLTNQFLLGVNPGDKTEIQKDFGATLLSPGVTTQGVNILVYQALDKANSQRTFLGAANEIAAILDGITITDRTFAIPQAPVSGEVQPGTTKSHVEKTQEDADAAKAKADAAQVLADKTQSKGDKDKAEKARVEAAKAQAKADEAQAVENAEVERAQAIEEANKAKAKAATAKLKAEAATIKANEAQAEADRTMLEPDKAKAITAKAEAATALAEAASAKAKADEASAAASNNGVSLASLLADKEGERVDVMTNTSTYSLYGRLGIASYNFATAATDTAEASLDQASVINFSVGILRVFEGRAANTGVQIGYGIGVTTRFMSGDITQSNQTTSTRYQNFFNTKSKVFVSPEFTIFGKAGDAVPYVRYTHFGGKLNGFSKGQIVVGIDIFPKLFGN